MAFDINSLLRLGQGGAQSLSPQSMMTQIAEAAARAQAFGGGVSPPIPGVLPPAPPAAVGVGGFDPASLEAAQQGQGFGGYGTDLYGTSPPRNPNDVMSPSDAAAAMRHLESGGPTEPLPRDDMDVQAAVIAAMDRADQSAAESRGDWGKYAPQATPFTQQDVADFRAKNRNTYRPPGPLARFTPEQQADFLAMMEMQKMPKAMPQPPGIPSPNEMPGATVNERAEALMQQVADDSQIRAQLGEGGGVRMFEAGGPVSKALFRDHMGRANAGLAGTMSDEAVAEGRAAATGAYGRERSRLASRGARADQMRAARAAAQMEQIQQARQAAMLRRMPPNVAQSFIAAQGRLAESAAKNEMLGRLEEAQRKASATQAGLDRDLRRETAQGQNQVAQARNALQAKELDTVRELANRKVGLDPEGNPLEPAKVEKTAYGNPIMGGMFTATAAQEAEIEKIKAETPNFHGKQKEEQSRRVAKYLKAQIASGQMTPDDANLVMNRAIPGWLGFPSTSKTVDNPNPHWFFPKRVGGDFHPFGRGQPHYAMPLFGGKAAGAGSFVRKKLPARIGKAAWNLGGKFAKSTGTAASRAATKAAAKRGAQTMARKTSRDARLAAARAAKKRAAEAAAKKTAKETAKSASKKAAQGRLRRRLGELRKEIRDNPNNDALKKLNEATIRGIESLLKQ